MTGNWSAQTAVVAGLGMTGQSCVRYLRSTGANIRCWDTRTGIKIPETINEPVCLGKPPVGYWHNVDVLVLSPGIATDLPAVLEAKAFGVTVIGDVELFALVNTVPCVGITGSNGKTTVTLLVEHILQYVGLNATAAGNVGTPVLDTLAQDWDALVLELSSFQLESTISLNLKSAAILNISDDHLDRHGSMDSYTSIKKRIYQHSEIAVYNRDDKATWPVDPAQPAISFGLTPSDTGYGWDNNYITLHGLPLLTMASTSLSGLHNVMNVQAALALVSALGVEIEQAIGALLSFKPVPHRCTLVAEHNQVLFVDDSKATNVGATIAAIKGLSPEVKGGIILIAGGDAKGANTSVLKPYLENHVLHTITIGRDGRAISDLCSPSTHVDSMLEAVNLAWQLAKPGDMVLLSPACASLDMYKNYQDRAEVFIQSIGMVVQ
jgi:UDP-N-acetylmuramoylalanine--D-glutamate ligase